MRETTRSGTQEGAQDGAEPSAAPHEDFLYHLYRGSDMLMHDRVVEAKGELERALALQPQDAKSQDLLAGVYFRLGFYPRAIEIWERLVEAYPKNATLRVNLGLALFKTGQAQDAHEHVRTALRLHPDHERAWGYLGLIQWRLGEVHQARDSFLRGGQATMARRMEDVLGSSAGEVEAAASDGPSSGTHDERRAEMRSAAEEAIEQFEASGVPLSVETGDGDHAGGGTWQATEPGQEGTRRAPRAPRSLPAAAPPRLSDRLDAWQVALPDDTPLAIGDHGELFVHAERDVYARLGGLRAVRGALRTGAVRRRMRNKELEESLGGDDPVMRWHGPVAAVVAPPDNGTLFGLTLDEDDLLYVREETLWAFDDRVGFESGRLPLGGRTAQLTQLHGTGTVVLRLAAAPASLRVEQGQEVRVDPASLVGWSGRLFPEATRGTAPHAAHAPPLVFRGDGMVLVA